MIRYYLIPVINNLFDFNLIIIFQLQIFFDPGIKCGVKETELENNF